MRSDVIKRAPAQQLKPQGSTDQCVRPCVASWAVLVCAADASGISWPTCCEVSSRRERQYPAVTEPEDALVCPGCARLVAASAWWWLCRSPSAACPPSD